MGAVLVLIRRYMWKQVVSQHAGRRCENSAPCATEPKEFLRCFRRPHGTFALREIERVYNCIVASMRRKRVDLARDADDLARFSQAFLLLPSPCMPILVRSQASPVAKTWIQSVAPRLRFARLPLKTEGSELLVWSLQVSAWTQEQCSMLQTCFSVATGPRAPMKPYPLKLGFFL